MAKSQKTSERLQPNAILANGLLNTEISIGRRTASHIDVAALNGSAAITEEASSNAPKNKLRRRRSNDIEREIGSLTTITKQEDRMLV